MTTKQWLLFPLALGLISLYWLGIIISETIGWLATRQKAKNR